MNKRGLGKGLSSLIPNGEPKLESKLINISVDEIFPNPLQPRKSFSEESLKELSDSIKRHGLVQPIVVKPKDMGYELISGERRWRAAKDAGHENILALVQNADQVKSLELALVENLQREDLNPMEEARAFAYLLEEHEITHEDIAARVGKDRTTITNSLRLLQLPDSVQEYLEVNEISAGHARAMMLIEDVDKQTMLAEKVAREGLSVRRTENIAKQWQQSTKIKKVKLDESKDRCKINEKLTEAFGAPAKVIDGKRGGKIEIKFRSDKELDKIINRVLNK